MIAISSPKVAFVLGKVRLDGFYDPADAICMAGKSEEKSRKNQMSRQVVAEGKARRSVVFA
jgi:hypothetical protein